MEKDWKKIAEQKTGQVNRLNKQLEELTKLLEKVDNARVRHTLGFLSDFGYHDTLNHILGDEQ